jgi:hypothetical protein
VTAGHTFSQSLFIPKSGLRSTHLVVTVFVVCHQVYHGDCLGFKPKGKWVCPRHMCMYCGDRKATEYFCRSVRRSFTHSLTQSLDHSVVTQSLSSQSSVCESVSLQVCQSVKVEGGAGTAQPAT